MKIISQLDLMSIVGENNACIPPTLEGWVYITPIHGPLYTWAQYTPTVGGGGDPKLGYGSWAA